MPSHHSTTLDFLSSSTTYSVLPLVPQKTTPVSPSINSLVKTFTSRVIFSQYSTICTICRTFLLAVSLSEPTPWPIRSCAASPLVSSLDAATTLRGQVAVKNSVCLAVPARGPSAPPPCSGEPCGRHRPTISRTCGMKPMASIASASSRTKYETCATSTAGARPSSLFPSMKSLRRPGVASKMSQPLFSCFNWAFFQTPPKHGTKRRPMDMASLATSVAICWMSSRVGASTSALGMAGSLAVDGSPLLRRRTSAGRR
mmetsp:Transcript_145238/g.278694  ORF Transcript_145238/g.278694 Transcript_145238/m.278694 type:complete len:257 (+) Transcript_145238:595-1365(+)